MRTSAVTAAAAAVLLGAAATGPARAAPIGTDNYDFATFAPDVATTDPAHYGGWTQLLGDLDGDGRVDRLVYALDAASWRTWSSRSTGDGSFATAIAWSAPGNWLGASLSVADVDGDRRADLVAVAADAAGWRAHTARSPGYGRFEAPIGWQCAGNFAGWSAFVADITGDHRADLVVAKSDAAGLQIALATGNGAGGFARPVVAVFPGDRGAGQLGLGDFDGDGRADLALEAADASGWRTWVARSLGGGGFAAPVAWQSSANYGGWSRARGDFDGDGRTDLMLWAADAASWRAWIALANGAGGFAPPVAWSATAAGTGWALAVADVNGDGGADLILQRPDGTGWQVRVAVASGHGGFLPPRPWGALGQHYGGWTPAAADFSGDGRADVMVFAVDAAGWRAHVATARGCDQVLRPTDDVPAAIAALPGSTGAHRTVCLAPGRYERELLIAGKRALSLIGAHGGVSIATQSYGFAPSATPGVDPGAPVQIWQSHDVVIDGVEIENRFHYQKVLGPDGQLDQTQMVSRAVEILGGTSITLANAALIGPGKQLLHIEDAQGVTVDASALRCYYFCVDAARSTVELRRTAFRAQHETAGDVHALFWTDHATQRYRNCTMEMVTGKSLFAGVNDFATDALEVTGTTSISPSAEAWVSQHPNYNGLNLTVRGSYPALLDWYMVDFEGGGWQAEAQICYAPDVGAAHCVSHAE